MKRAIYTLILVAAFSLGLKSQATPSSPSEIRNLLPRQFEFTTNGPAYLWKSKNQKDNVVLVELKRSQAQPRSLLETQASVYRIFQDRQKLLESTGMKNIFLQAASASSFHSDGTRIDYEMTYTAASGARMKVMERIYSSADSVRDIAFRAPEKSFRAAHATQILNRLEPKWSARQPASDSTKSEAGLCPTCSNPDASTAPKGLEKFNAQNPVCKDVAKEDLRHRDEKAMSWASDLLQDGMLASGVGCLQGLVSAGKDLISGLWSSAKGIASLTFDTKYREEVMSALGLVSSEFWSDPVGVAKKLVTSVATTLMKEWDALPCLNDRAGERVLCKAVAGTIAGGYALKVLKLGVAGARTRIPGFSKALKEALKPGAEAGAKFDDVIADHEIPKPSAAAAPSDAAANSVLESPAEKLPFKKELAAHLEEAKALGGVNEDLFTSRLKELEQTGKSADVASDELRRLNLVLDSVLKEKGQTVAERVDKFLKKHVKASERDALKACLLKK